MAASYIEFNFFVRNASECSILPQYFLVVGENYIPIKLNAQKVSYTFLNEYIF